MEILELNVSQFTKKINGQHQNYFNILMSIKNQKLLQVHNLKQRAMIFKKFSYKGLSK